MIDISLVVSDAFDIILSGEIIDIIVHAIKSDSSVDYTFLYLALMKDFE